MGMKFGLVGQSLAVLKYGLTFRAFKTLIMDSGWSINWITLKISLKILEFYGAKYLSKSFLSMMIFSKYIFLWILALSVLGRGKNEGCFRACLPRKRGFLTQQNPWHSPCHVSWFARQDMQIMWAFSYLVCSTST